jgi:hypothetical protein
MISAWQTMCEAVQGNRGLVWGVWWNIGLLVASVAAMPFDGRKILGLNPWIKPVKFEISVIVFLATIAVLLWALPDAWRTTKVWVGWGMGIAMIVEDTIIAMQSLRGVRSHMNFSTPLDATLFAVMGLFIALNTVLAAWLLIAWCRTGAALPPAVVWGIRLGLLMLVLGSIEGVRIVGNGGHTVGADDGGVGLPFVNWSTGFGDLRVAHFFALHALQIFPLIGMALAATKLRASIQMSGLFAFAAAYGATVWWMFAEAMQGIPLVK